MSFSWSCLATIPNRDGRKNWTSQNLPPIISRPIGIRVAWKTGLNYGISLRSFGDAWWGINWNADSTSARVIATIFLGWREGRERETERKGNRVENIERFSMEMVLILFERMKIDERRSKPSSSRLIIHLSHRLSR